ncbi:MAG: hypothetical protein M5R40_16070 [Anaerolineae bacterium]|nr:hypothetical protein [Anaerolineae bacterium]
MVTVAASSLLLFNTTLPLLISKLRSAPEKVCSRVEVKNPDNPDDDYGCGDNDAKDFADVHVSAPFLTCLPWAERCTGAPFRRFNLSVAAGC